VKYPTSAKNKSKGGGIMRWFFIAMLAMPVAAAADVYVAIPSDTSQALYFPNVDFVQCYSAVVDSAPAIVRTDRCYQIFLPAVFVQGNLLMMNRPIDQLLASCAPLSCELRAMPND
jgi:hypothetical protein